MKNILLVLLFSISLFANEIIIKESHCSVNKTVQNIKNIVSKKKLHVFAVINHSGNAKMVGMKLNESKMVIFGNAKLGTSLMQQEMTIGLDLPLRILVFRDTDGKVKMAYRDGSWLANHHLLHANKKVQKMNDALEKITNKAGQCKRD